MIKEIEGLDDGIIGFHASGVVTKEDYTTKLIPAVERELDKHSKISVLYVIDDNFDHYAWQAMPEDTKVGFVHPFGWDKIAIVTDVEWILNAIKYTHTLMPFKLKTYSSKELDEAKKWVQEKECHLNITLDEEKHILVLAPQGVLTKDDFQYLATVVDPYFAKGNTLKGLMLKSKKLPGWDSLLAMREHLSFIKRHHEKIDKLAFVIDSSFIDIFQSLAKGFVHPEIKEFNHEEENNAFKWLEAQYDKEKSGYLDGYHYIRT